MSLLTPKLLEYLNAAEIREDNRELKRMQQDMTNDEHQYLISNRLIENPLMFDKNVTKRRKTRK